MPTHYSPAVHSEDVLPREISAALAAERCADVASRGAPRAAVRSAVHARLRHAPRHRSPRPYGGTSIVAITQKSNSRPENHIVPEIPTESRRGERALASRRK